jgi:hypothetical protein
VSEHHFDLVVITASGNVSEVMAPNRTPAPTRTSQRTSRPSQRAAPTPTRVTKITNNAQRAAVTKVLLAPIATAALAAAPVSEVGEVVAQDEVREALAALPVAPPTPFSYRLQWRAVVDKEELYAETQRLQSNMPVVGVEKVADWLKMLKDEQPNYELVRTTVAASHSSLPTKDRPMASYDSESYTEMLTYLIEYERHGRIGVTISVVSHCRLFDLQANLDGLNAPRASQASQAPRAIPHPRQSATTRQEAAMPAERQQLEGRGNFSSSIIARWTCIQRSCANYQKQCFYPSKDESPLHVPIIQPVMLAWSEGIRDGDLSAIKPTLELYGQMVEAKALLTTTPRRRANQTTSQSPEHHFHVHHPPTIAPIAPVLDAPSRSGIPSSPIRMPSSELSGSEELATFFGWCKEQSFWRTEHARLDAAFIILDVKCYDVGGMTAIPQEQWEHFGLMLGLRSRLKKSAKKWRDAGMPMPVAE